MINLLCRNTQIDKIFDEILLYLPLEKIELISDWAEKNRFMTSKVTAAVGPFSFDYAPYIREIADCFVKSNPIQYVAIMKAAQVAGTTGVIENTIGAKIANDPCPMMLTSANIKLLDSYKKVKIDNLIDNSGLRHKIRAETKNKNSRRQGDTATMIEFPGGYCRFVNAGIADEIRSLPAKLIFMDEVEAYKDELPDEGDTIALIEGRAVTYHEFKKICYISTPLKKHNSKIYPLFKKGDQRKYYVPCPHCGAYQELIFYERDGGLYPDEKGNLTDGVLEKPYGLIFSRFEDGKINYNSVVYKCKHCGEGIKEAYKKEMLKRGYWKPTAIPKEPNFVSYYISGLLSVPKSWKDIVKNFVNSQHDPKALQTFYNLDLGLPFEDRTAGIDIKVAHRLRDDSIQNNHIPEWVLFLTAAVDVQDDRLEVEIKAWGDRWRNHGVDHRVFYGKTDDINDTCWQALIAMLNEDFGGKQLELIVIDSGDGDKTELVYTICELYGQNILYPLKGFVSTLKSTQKYKIVPLKNHRLSLIEIYVDFYKSQLTRWYSQEWRHGENYPPGWVSYAAGFSDEFLKQLTREQMIKYKRSNGTTGIKWVAKGRNEAFDLDVYNLCAAEIVVSAISEDLGYEQVNAMEVFDYLKGEANELDRAS